MKILLCGLVFLVIGTIMLAAPNIIYQITESWKNNSSTEPSNFYKWNIRIGGIAFLLVGAASIIIYFVL